MSIETITALDRLVERVGYPFGQFTTGLMDEGYYVQLHYLERDVDSGELERQRGRKWYVSKWATDGEVVQTMLLAALTSAEHRVREHFLIDGVRVYGPHVPLEQMLAFVRESGTEKREPMPAAGSAR